jgi:surfeit locus 1 family protein
MLKKFRPTLVGTLVTICCIPLFIKLGFWQYSKAEQKQSLQAQYDASSSHQAEAIPSDLSNPDALRYKQVEVHGEYVKQYQILLDNQVEGQTAGYHVITPLKIEGKDELVLVDRGWIAALDTHADIPQIEVPKGPQKILGQLWVPSKKFYTLKPQSSENGQWQVLWQNMDMEAYAKAVSPKVLPVVIRMSPESEGGFVRNWIRPDDRITTHLGYAYQWFGFAFAAFAIYLFVGFRRGNNTSINESGK